ncbi:Coiled-coil domain-containing protein 65 [Nibea albiflora]|uniref:Coiled-coil domain-containing protein 65 n=1 Tax=Nibea albiflora TaxID=240163 RepID=A0ACB7FGM4_NIBAL|nr:Coiled-coil domain-containing protein 65 [Nibea albiflora]
MLLQDSQQQEEKLEAAMSFMEDKHEAVLKDMHKLYLRSSTLYKTAYEERVSEKTGLPSPPMKEKEKEKEEPKKGPANDNFEKMMWKNMQDVQEANKDMKKMMRMHSRELNMKKLPTEDTRAQLRLERLRLAQAQKDGRKRLTNLSIQSNNAAKKLQTVIAQGERLLHVGEVCQKLERKLEKASAISFSTTEHQEEKTGPETEEPAKKVLEFPELHQLTQRLTDVVLQRDTLKIHKVELKQENEQLKLQLHEQLDDMILSNKTFSGPDAPLTVQRALTTKAANTNTPNTRSPTANTPTTTEK